MVGVVNLEHGCYQGARRGQRILSNLGITIDGQFMMFFAVHQGVYRRSIYVQGPTLVWDTSRGDESWEQRAKNSCQRGAFLVA